MLLSLQHMTHGAMGGFDRSDGIVCDRVHRRGAGRLTVRLTTLVIDARYHGIMISPTPQLALLPIRTATTQDLDAIDSLERACFPPAEAASRTSISSRLAVFPDHFWLLEARRNTDSGDHHMRGNRTDTAGRTDTDLLVSFVNGMVTDQPHLLDDMYDRAEMHDPHGAWQMIFGVDTHPDYRRHGYAARVLHHAIDTARAEHRRGVVLTCKDRLVHFYASFGFRDEGMSASTHGGVPWHEMRLTF